MHYAIKSLYAEKDRLIGLRKNKIYRFPVFMLSQPLFDFNSLLFLKRLAAFQNNNKMPIASYMKEYRMKLASNMLLQEDKSISGIAAAVGYKSQSKFTSAFRDIFQILPTAYQKLYRNQ